jgi:hypothetical protein
MTVRVTSDDDDDDPNGLLRQGCRNIHQVLHLDNYSVLSDATGIWLKYAKEGITKLNMDEGVVVDMPLSPKGSYVQLNAEAEIYQVQVTP